MKKIKRRNIIIITIVYIVVNIALLIAINQHLLGNDTNRALDASNRVQLFLEKNPNAQLPSNYEVFKSNVKNDDTLKIAEGAPYSRQLSSGSIILTSPIYEDGQIKGYLKVTQDRTQTFFINSLIIFFALLIYLTFGVITVERSRRNYVFTQNIIAKIKNIERSPLTQSYLIGDDTDRISVALNHLGETIQRQLLSHAEKKKKTSMNSLNSFHSLFLYTMVKVASAKQMRYSKMIFPIHKTWIYLVLMPNFCVSWLIKCCILISRKKFFYFEQLSAYYQVRITPLPELDNRFIVTMMDITRYQKNIGST